MIAKSPGCLFLARSLCTAVVAFCSAFSAEPSAVPILRIEAGMHTADMIDLSTDRAGRLALTTAEDKTARLWDIKTGRLLRVFRPPITEGWEGLLYAGALSPDGTLCVMGGHLAAAAGEEMIYIFDTGSGHLLRQIRELPNVTYALSFSASGRYLAAGFGGKGGGIRIWETAAFSECARDAKYEVSCSSLDWFRDERLVVACRDTSVRVYEPKLGTSVPSGDSQNAVNDLTPAVSSQIWNEKSESTCCVRVSPDGKKIGVGIFDGGAVMLLDSATLKSLTKFNRGDLVRSPAFAWSADGNHIMGEVDRDGLGTWDRFGKAHTPSSDRTVGRLHGIRSLPDGSFVATSSAGWSTVSSTGQIGSLHPPAKCDLTMAGTGVMFRSADCTNVATEIVTQHPRFSSHVGRLAIAERRWEVQAGSSDNWPKELKMINVDEAGFRSAGHPTFDGKPLTKPMIGFEPLADKHEGLLIKKVTENGPAAGAGLTAECRIVSVAGQRIAGSLLQEKINSYYEALNRASADARSVPFRVLFKGDEAPREVMIEPDRINDDEEKTCSAISTPLEFCLAAGSSLLRFNRSGARAWIKELPSKAWAIGLSVDNSIAVIAHRDGVFRWYRTQDGKHLLSFFSHSDFKHWVLWTPEGFYDCSPGGEDLIGWHINRGAEKEADFFPAARFREQFYRPDVIDRVLKTQDVAEAVRLANEARRKKIAEVTDPAATIKEKLPPIVELAMGGPARKLELAAGVPAVTLRYKVRAGSAPTSRVRILVDGRPSLSEPAVPQDAETVTTTDVLVPAYDCTLSVIADNRFASSEPATLEVVRPGGAVKKEAAKEKSRLFILAAGVSDYLNDRSITDLRWAAQDAEDIVSAFKSQSGRAYESVEARLLTNSQATAGNILDGLDWLRAQTTPRDVAIVSLSGHGGNDANLRFYFCAHDFDPGRELRTSVGFEEIQRTVNSVPGKVIFFLDCCHAGNALGKLTGPSGPVADVNRVMNELASDENGAVVFSSSLGRQLSRESEEWRNGAFTHALVEGLNGKADLLGKGTITVASLEAYVAARVKELTNGKQTPCEAKPQTVPDFVIAVKGGASPGKKKR